MGGGSGGGNGSGGGGLRKPLKKRHSMVYGGGQSGGHHLPQTTCRVNQYLSQAIKARSVDQEKSTHVNLLTLCFKDKLKERKYHQEKDRGFVYAIAFSLLLLCLVAAMQMVILPG